MPYREGLVPIERAIWTRGRAYIREPIPVVRRSGGRGGGGG
jgi:hypothetical protein